MNPRSQIKRARIKRELNAIWGELIHQIGGGKCLSCGREDTLQAAHLISKGSNPALRWDILNGVLLCNGCHRALDGAASYSKARVLAVIERYAPLHHAYMEKYRHAKRTRMTDCDLIDLRDELKKQIEAQGGTRHAGV